MHVAAHKSSVQQAVYSLDKVTELGLEITDAEHC
jgi:hypothetical protein